MCLDRKDPSVEGHHGCPNKVPQMGGLAVLGVLGARILRQGCQWAGFFSGLVGSQTAVHLCPNLFL